MIKAMNKMTITGRKEATIFDVARLAGVSIKTVSRVANGQPSVRVETRSRVQEAIDKLEYQANPSARYLGSLRSQLPEVSAAKTAQETSD